MKKDDINRLFEKGVISSLDIHFARFVSSVDEKYSPEVFLGAALVSSYKRNGHICLDLLELEGKTLLEEEAGSESILCPPLNTWLEKLKKSASIGSPGDYTPLVLDENARLYLYRYWQYQNTLSEFILKKVREKNDEFSADKIKTILDRLFPPENSSEAIDFQKVSAFASLYKDFCVISGGPGTGKTTTVARMMAFLVELHAPEKLRIFLAAPTGKAAARLQESIKSEKTKILCSDIIKENIPDKASTIHRLLKSIPGSPYFRYHAGNPLPADVVIIDEASMIDIALMSKLVQALLPQSRLILMGDKNQLSSVEAGAVLGDICDTGHFHHFSGLFSKKAKEATGYSFPVLQKNNDESGISDSIIQLQKSYRFKEKSGIGLLSRSIQSGDVKDAGNHIRNGSYADIKWQDLPLPRVLKQTLKQTVVNGFKGYLRAEKPEEKFNEFQRFRILCALREGPYGVYELNDMIEQILAEENLINPQKSWYPGRPVMITRNHYHLKLFNGDIGITLPDNAEKDDLRVFFMTADGCLKKIHPFRLPEHETVYAMTVHKSQGSEFEKMILLLPDIESRVLTRELIYTGITRAKKNVEIWGIEKIFNFAVSRQIKRSSGLRDVLWGG